MHEDIIKFRKIVATLLTEKRLTMADVVKNLGTSEPTYYKIVQSENPKIRASVLAKIQDFSRTHISYASIPSGPVKEDSHKETKAHDDPEVAKFVAIYKALIDGKILKKEAIMEVSNLSTTTIHGFMTGEIKQLRRDTREKLQKFNLKYANYSGSTEQHPDKITDKELDNTLEKAGKMLKGYDPGKQDPPLTDDVKFWNIIRTIHQIMPKDISITITIGSKS